MFQPAPREPLRQRVAGAILEAAANVLAARGDDASMTDVAAAAGVARATVYRYFPTRQALLDELAQIAASDAAGRLTSARIDEVAPEEGVARAVRSLIEVGDYLIVLARERSRANPPEFERAIGTPLRALFERGQSAGDIRDDIPSSWLTESLVGMVVNILVSTPTAGKEDTIAAISSLFLDGARARRRGVHLSSTEAELPSLARVRPAPRGHGRRDS